MEKITVTKTYEVYNFDELSQEIQEKLLEKQINNCVEFYCEYSLKDDMNYEAEKLLEKYFGQKARLEDVYYDLSYCQGSGAMIEFDLTYYGCELSIKQNGHYYHEHSFVINEIGDKYLSDERYKYLHDKIVDMNRELGKIGYDLIDYKHFTEIAKEELLDKRFLENGEEF